MRICWIREKRPNLWKFWSRIECTSPNLWGSDSQIYEVGFVNHDTNRTFLESGFATTIQTESIDLQNESMFLRISYMIPATLLIIDWQIIAWLIIDHEILIVRYLIVRYLIVRYWLSGIWLSDIDCQIFDRQIYDCQIFDRQIFDRQILDRQILDRQIFDQQIFDQ